MAYMFHQEDLSNLENFYDYALVQMKMNFKGQIHKNGV